MFKQTIALVILFISLPFAFAQQEELTITTYYPSPYGVYSTLRLYPRTDIDVTKPCLNEGEMFYDGKTDALYVCVNGVWTAGGGGYWRASPSNPNNIYNINPGNVGIGTTSPAAKLTLSARQGDGGGTWYGGLLVSSADPWSPEISIAGVKDVNGIHWAYSGIYSFPNGDFIIQPRWETGSRSLLLAPYAGQVGIGTQSPDANSKLTVAGNVLLSAPGSRIGFCTGDGWLAIKQVDGGRLKLGKYPDASDNTLVVKPYDGRVGIGTADPQEPLHVDGNIRLGGYDSVLHAQTPNKRYYDLIGAYQGWDQNTVYIAGYNAINKPGERSTTKVVIGGSGSREIKFDVRPTFDAVTIEEGNVWSRWLRLSRVNGLKFDVVNNHPLNELVINVYDPVRNEWTNGAFIIKWKNGYRIGSSSLAGTTQWSPVTVDSDGMFHRSAPSLRNYKKDIKDLAVSLEALVKLRPVRFRWKATNEEGVGLIAEEVEQVIKELVAYDDKGKLATVKSDQLSFYLLAAVKELKVENEALKKRIENLESKAEYRE